MISGVVVVGQPGEPQRAFYGNQFGLTFPVLVHYGFALWMPEVGGAVDPGSDAHDLVMSLYGGMSKGERTRIKTRVRTAMAAQAQIEGRFLGGRPPYGYLLVDAGPHPNPGKAAAGQDLRRLAPDPVAAPIVGRIFAEFVAGHGLHRIAESLNDDLVPSPSAHDPERNRHLAVGRGLWAKSAVRAILTNPRYTGHQVWNRQRRDEVLVDVDDVALGHEAKMRWNDPSAWVWSAEPTHDPLVTVELFQAAQAQFEAKRRKTTQRPRENRRYLLASLIRCDECGRVMQGHWVRGEPYYRCRFPDDYPTGPAGGHPKNVYVKERAVVPGLDAWLGSLFDDDHLEDTCRVLAGASQTTTEEGRRAAALRRQIEDCDRRLAQYRRTLDAGADPTTIATWMADVQRERRALELQLGQHVPGEELTTEQVRLLVAALKDIVQVLGSASRDDKAELYATLGIDLTFDHRSRQITAETRPRRLLVRVGGGT